jgi:hypothetical protein
VRRVVATIPEFSARATEKNACNGRGVMYGCGMKTASQIIDYIGLPTLRAALGVKPDAIRKARRKGQIPAAWYDTCERLAGRPLPREVFSFRGVAE